MRRYAPIAVCAAGVFFAGCGSNIANQASGDTAASAKSAQLTPNLQLGYVWNASTRELDAVQGVIGASRTGSPVTAAGAYVSAEASPATQALLAADAAGNLVAAALPSGQPETIARGVTGVPVFRFARSGQYAVAFVPATTQAWLISGLPSSASVRALSPGGAVTDAAVSDAGNTLLAEQSGGSIHAVNSGGNAIATLSASGGMAFLRGTDTAILADRGANTIAIAKNASGNAQVQALSIPAGVLLQPVALEASLDGHYAVAANSAESSAARIDLTGQSPAIKFSLPVQPTRVAPLSGTAAFAFNLAGEAPVWAADATAETPVAVFIPARVSAGTGGGQ